MITVINFSFLQDSPPDEDHVPSEKVKHLDMEWQLDCTETDFLCSSV